jgi:hypothetical protein
VKVCSSFCAGGGGCSERPKRVSLRFTEGSHKSSVPYRFITASRHADADGSLNRAVKIRAASATQAAFIAERDNPDCVALRDYVRKVQQ